MDCTIPGVYFLSIYLLQIWEVCLGSLPWYKMNLWLINLFHMNHHYRKRKYHISPEFAVLLLNVPIYNCQNHRRYYTHCSQCCLIGMTYSSRSLSPGYDKKKRLIKLNIPHLNLFVQSACLYWWMIQCFYPRTHCCLFTLISCFNNDFVNCYEIKIFNLHNRLFLQWSFSVIFFVNTWLLNVLC